MAYRVIWRESAKNRLLELWLAARDRFRLNAAAERLDELLARDPLSAGESRVGEERIVLINPIWCRFRVDEAAKLVYVEAVWRTR